MDNISKVHLDNSQTIVRAYIFVLNFKMLKQIKVIARVKDADNSSSGLKILEFQTDFAELRNQQEKTDKNAQDPVPFAEEPRIEKDDQLPDDEQLLKEVTQVNKEMLLQSNYMEDIGGEDSSDLEAERALTKKSAMTEAESLRALSQLKTILAADVVPKKIRILINVYSISIVLMLAITSKSHFWLISFECPNNQFLASFLTLC